MARTDLKQTIFTDWDSKTHWDKYKKEKVDQSTGGGAVVEMVCCNTLHMDTIFGLHTM